MKVIGLTGGIACGKSTVTHHLIHRFLYKKLVVLDTDEIARNLRGDQTGEAYEQIVKAFGRGIFVEFTQHIDSSKLGKIVFNDPKAMNTLNEIMQPLITREIQETIDRCKRWPLDVVVLIDSALLYEGGWDSFCDEIMVVGVAPEVQLQRLMERNHLDEATAKARIALLQPERIVRDKPVHLIDNSGSPNYLRFQLEPFIERWDTHPTMDVQQQQEQP